ncbi:MAG: bifunctional nuclease family protein [Bacteroidetes bacterium]|nr:bifunctional nuclease family protein [Bacteroidota bacterium]
MEKIAVEILGLSSTPSHGGAYALLLKEVNGKRQLPIIIGAFEASSIAMEMEGVKPPRPLTHDLIRNILENLSLNIVDVTINELRDGTFYAKISVENLSQVIEIDSRPSDAIAIAVRFGAPIYVAEEVINEAGLISEETEDDEEEEKSVVAKKIPILKLSELEQLELKLQKFIEDENYEQAAKMRDEIKKFQLRH